jgi:hypothetical protein
MGNFSFKLSSSTVCLAIIRWSLPEIITSFFHQFKIAHMKQFNSGILLPAFRKTLMLFVLLLGGYYVSFSQVYYATLTGPAEVPPNVSPGTGKALVTIDLAASTMRVQASFSGLLAGVTASHIHAPTTVAGAGTAGVATTLPTFPGFPAGVTAGTYDQTFNMLLASSYNPAYMNANGGTPTSAFAALTTAIAAGKSYLNIHSTMFPGGEIRGFLLACPNIQVTIPDAFALTKGTVANTVYPAYSPASSLMLQANVTGGTGPYTYNWSNGATTASTTVSPTTTTTYTANVTDQNGCQGTGSKTVQVMDISGGNNGNKIMVCHKGQNSLTIAAPAVADHLQHGDMLGSCVTTQNRSVPQTGDIAQAKLVARVMANPASGYFELLINGSPQNSVQLKVYDLTGRMIESRSSLQPNQKLKFGNSYHPGVYLAEIVQGTEVQTLRLVKTN